MAVISSSLLSFFDTMCISIQELGSLHPMYKVSRTWIAAREGQHNLPFQEWLLLVFANALQHNYSLLHYMVPVFCSSLTTEYPG